MQQITNKWFLISNYFFTLGTFLHKTRRPKQTIIYFNDNSKSRFALCIIGLLFTNEEQQITIHSTINERFLGFCTLKSRDENHLMNLQYKTTSSL